MQENPLKGIPIYNEAGLPPCNQAAPLEFGLDDTIVQIRAISLNQTVLPPCGGDNGVPASLRFENGGAAGTVADSREAQLHPGDAVCIYPVAGCRRCDVCTSGREYMCAQRYPLVGFAGASSVEAMRVSHGDCAPMPSGLSFEEAAALAPHLTAWRMLTVVGKLKPGEFLLIVDIGSDITVAALQIGVQLGARVLVTSKRENRLAAAARLGAEYGFNADGASLVKELRGATAKHGADVAINCSGGNSWATTLACLARGGRLVAGGAAAGAQAPTDLRRIFWNHLKIYGSSFGSRGDFEKLLQLCAGSQIRPFIDRIFPWEQRAAAQSYIACGESFGSVVLSAET